MGIKIALGALQGKWASSSIEGGISWVFLGCSGKLVVPLELRRGPQGTSCVASRISSLLSSWKGEFVIALELLQGNQGSSLFEGAVS